MGLQLSTGLRNFIQQNGCITNALQNGVLRIYSGAQPATADTAASGTLLVEVSAASVARTAEVLASGTLTLAGTSGSVNSVTVNGVQLLAPFAGASAVVVPFDTDLPTTANDVANTINSGTWWHRYFATAASAVITIQPLPGYGATANGQVVAFSGTTLTATTTNLSGGVTPANGLDFSLSALGALNKGPGVWSGLAGNTGTAGWFRFTGSQADAGAATTTLIRLDGVCGTTGTGANLSMSSTTVTAATTTTIDSFTLTEPAC